MRDWLCLLGHMPLNKNGEKWFERDAGDARLAQDRQLIAKNHPNLEFALNFGLCKAVLRGTIVLREENSGISTPVKIKILFPDNYPQAEPFAYDDGNQFTHVADRHFYTTGLCCLWLPLESQWNSSEENTLLNFVDQVAIFFERQLMYDACGYWAWGERGHGEAGFIEFFQEQLGVDYKTFETFMPLLMNETIINNKARCPCGGNQNYSLCHKQKVELVKNSIKNLPLR